MAVRSVAFCPRVWLRSSTLNGLALSRSKSRTKTRPAASAMSCFIATGSRRSKLRRQAGRGVSTATAHCSACWPKRTESGSRTCLTRCWRSTRRLSIRLPHQITAVYGEMLSRQPLRFLLADDPGAGKTIMTGLFIKELMARGDSPAVLDRLPRQSCRAVAGRTRPPVPPAVRDHDKRRARSRTHRQLVQRERLGHLPPRQAQPRRGRAGQAPADRLGPDRLRRSPQAQRHLLRQRGQVHQALPARAAPLDAHPPFPAADGHAAQRQRGRLPAIHGLARRRPLRRASSATACMSPMPRT